MIGFILNSILFGFGLSMDAFCISVANALAEPDMKKSRACLIAGIFAFFQVLMPVVGWLCVSTLAAHFETFRKVVPYIAFVLLAWIGGGMLIRGIKGKTEEEKKGVGVVALLVQGIATSIDALSVGFTMADMGTGEAVAESLIIGAVTFAVCAAGVYAGKRVGLRLAGRAQIPGGIILLFIGLRILIAGV